MDYRVCPAMVNELPRKLVAMLLRLFSVCVCVMLLTRVLEGGGINFPPSNCTVWAAFSFWSRFASC